MHTKRVWTVLRTVWILWSGCLRQQENRILKTLYLRDLFQDRQKIDVATYSLTFDILAKYCDGSINLWLLLGNHDFWYHDKWDISSVFPFFCIA